MGQHKRKRKQHRDSCERKRKHPTLEEEQLAARLYVGVEAYRCLWCNFWHTGHIWGMSRRSRGQGQEEESE